LGEQLVGLFAVVTVGAARVEQFASSTVVG
jgi:hypothetical protein